MHLALTNDYDAIVVHWGAAAPLDSVAMVCVLRDNSSTPTPPIMLTARDELADKLTGFRAGADDYLTYRQVTGFGPKLASAAMLE